MFYPQLKPGQTSKTSAKDYLRRHRQTIYHFCTFHQPPLYNIHNVVGDFLDFADEHPVEACEIIYDFSVPNKVKREWVYGYMFKEPRLIYTAGKRGGGKNHVTYSNMTEAQKRGLTTNIVGMAQKAHPTINVISDLFDADEGSFNVLDEVGITHSARERDSEVTEDTVSLAVARHHGKWVNAISQTTSMGDVNFIRLADILILKEMSMFGLAYERDSIADQVPSYFVPKEKTTTFVMTDDFRCTVQFEPSPLWSEEFSKPYSILPKEEKVPTILELFEAGTRPSMIAKFLSARSIRSSKADVMDVLMKEGKIQKEVKK